MDEILRRVFVPRGNSRHRRRGSAEEDAVWADTLDWQTSDYDLYSIFRRVFDRLDSDYREFGLRLDQLGDHEELVTAAMRAARWYREAGQQYRTVGIYMYLYRDLQQYLSKRMRRALDARNKQARDAA